MICRDYPKSHWGDGRFLQVSGLRFTYHAKQSNGNYTYIINPSEVEIRLRGTHGYSPLDLNKIYKVASTDFIWEKGYSDGYEIFSKGAGKTSPPRIDKNSAISFRKVVEDAINALPNKTVTEQIEGRIVRQTN